MLPTPDNTVGALLIGGMASAVLWGCTNMQTARYIINLRYREKEWLVYKIAVMLLWSLDAVHFILTVQVIYHYCISSFGNISSLRDIELEFKVQVTINQAIILLVQALYAGRIYKLGGTDHRKMSFAVAFAVLLGWFVGIAVLVEIFPIHYFAELSRISWLIILAFTTLTSIDIFMAIVICHYLRQHTARFPSLNTRIISVMQYTMGSGVITSITSLAALITYVLWPDTLIFMAIEVLLTKLYINSFLAMLNARKCNKESDEESRSRGTVMFTRFPSRLRTSICLSTRTSLPSPIYKTSTPRSATQLVFPKSHTLLISP